jgi:hypothetical protein
MQLGWHPMAVVQYIVLLYPADMSCLFPIAGEEINSDFMPKDTTVIFSCWHCRIYEDILLTWEAEITFRGCYI